MNVRQSVRTSTMAVRGAVTALPRLHALKDVETFCLFVGFARSGHSLVGQLLDAHPEAVVAHELDALAYLAYPRYVLYGTLIRQARNFARSGAAWTGYSYAIPGQWQGRYRAIKVIGDKKGGRTSGRLADNPDLLRQLRARVGVPVKIVLVTRNPFDNIATLVRKDFRDFQQALEYYEVRCEAIERVMAEVGQDLLHVHHEDLIADPRNELTRLCGLLGIEPFPGYLQACASIVLDTPRRPGQSVDWPRDVRAAIEGLIARFPFLQRYEHSLPAAH